MLKFYRFGQKNISNLLVIINQKIKIRRLIYSLTIIKYNKMGDLEKLDERQNSIFPRDKANGLKVGSIQIQG